MLAGRKRGVCKRQCENKENFDGVKRRGEKHAIIIIFVVVVVEAKLLFRVHRQKKI